MTVSPEHACKKIPVSSSSKPNLKKIWGVQKNLVKNKVTWEIKKNLAERRLMDLDDLQNKNADTGNIVLPTICYKAEPITSFHPDNCVGTSTSAMVRALKVQKNLSPQSPSFLKLILGSHVSRGFRLGLPKRFCDFHLPNQDDTIVLVDEDEQEYNTKYLLNKNGLSGGWRGFSIAHKLLEGDVLIFQLVEPRKLKVHIVRASGLTEVDGAGSNLNLETEINPVKTVYQPAADDSSGGTKTAKRKYLEPIAVDDQTHIFSSYNAIVAYQSGKIHNDLKSEDVEHIRFSQTNIKFNDIKCFKDFNIHVNGVTLDSEIPAHFRVEYYDLCCSQNKFLHENLVQGLNSKLVTGMISEIVSTAEAIKSARHTTPLNHLETRDKTLKAFEDLGMAVGFLRSRIHQLVTLSQESQAIKSKRKERDEAVGEMKALEAKLLKVKAVVTSLNAEIHNLEVEHRELGVGFRDIARAAW